MSSSYSHHCSSGHEQALHPPSTAQKDVSSWPSMKRSSSSDSIGGGAKTCVCSPTTHAGSFRCRLHRNSDSFSSAHAHPAPSSPQDPSPPLPPSAARPSMTATASRTVEAQ